MKILQIIHKQQHRGAETFACQISNHLISLGHKVRIVAIYKGAANLPFKGEIESLGANPGNRFFDLAVWKKLSLVIKEFKPDVVQANSGDTLKYAVLSKIFFKWENPIVVRNASQVSKYLNSFLQKKFNGFLYRKVERVISVSKASEENIIKEFPFLEGKTRVIPIGLEEIDQIIPKYFEPEEYKHIVHVGGFTFEKNHKGLLRIFNRVLLENSRVKLHLLGDGPLKKEIEKQVKQQNLEDKVKFYGFVSNPLPYIVAADVLMLPSLIEGLPGVLLEAMYCKVPVIAYDVGGVSEIVTEKTGVLVNEGDELMFSNALLQTISKNNDKRIKNAYENVSHKFMNKNIAVSFQEMFQNVVADLNERTKILN